MRWAFAGLCLYLIVASYVQHGRIESLNAELALANISLAAKKGEIDSINRSRAKESEIRAEYLKTIRDQENEIHLLSDGVANGTIGLSVSAVCTDGMPESSDAGRAENKTAKLAPHAERAYLRLRAEIAKAEAWITMCHSHANE